MTYEEFEEKRKNKILKEFKNHRAFFSNQGDIQILDWKDPETITYLIRYVIDNDKIYISGDLGSAILRFYDVNIKSFKALKNTNRTYFLSKLECCCHEKKEFNQAVFETELEEKINEIIDEYLYDNPNKTKYDFWNQEYNYTKYKDIYEDIIDNYRSEYESNFQNIDIHPIEKLFADNDFWEWFYDLGFVTAFRLDCYYYGLMEAIKNE